MQALSVTPSFAPYNADMPMGRPPKTKRSELGERISALRERAGLSQTQLAQKLGIGQQTVGYWERRAVVLKPAQIEAVASALGCTPQEILGLPQPKTRGSGPVGRLRQVFEQASKLPRSQQAKVAEFLEAFVERQQKTG